MKEDTQKPPSPTIQSESSSELLIDLTGDHQPSPDQEDSSSASSQDMMRLDLPESSENIASGKKEILPASSSPEIIVTC